MRDGETPRIYYTDPTGLLRGPFENHLIFNWYKQGFFSDGMLFRLENDETQISLGELTDRFGKDSPFESYCRWRSQFNGAQVPENSKSSSPCSDCKKNGEKLDSLLAAVLRIQQAIENNSQQIASNTSAITSLRSVFEESRLSAWKWNSVDDGPEIKDPTNSIFSQLFIPKPVLPEKHDIGRPKEDPVNFLGSETSILKNLQLQSSDWNGAGVLHKSESAGQLRPIEFTKHAAEVPIFEKAKPEPAESKPRAVAATKKPEGQKSFLEGIRQRNGATGETNGGEAKVAPAEPNHENDWVNANTKPTFHPFPSTPAQPAAPVAPPASQWTTVGGQNAAPLPNNQPVAPPSGFVPNWANSFSPLQQTTNRPPPPNQVTSFAAAALKERREINIPKKPEPEETGPRLVPIGKKPPIIIRRVPNNK